MKPNKLLLIVLSSLIFFSCNENINTSAEDENKAETNLSEEVIDLNDRSFSNIFFEIDPLQITDNVFKLFAQDNCLLTSGKENDFNSMVIGSGGFGNLDRSSICWTTLRSTRYTLEYINNYKSFTFSFFEDVYKEEFLKFGQTSGRDTNKMQETKLSAISTPSGMMTFREARLVIECELIVNSPYSYEYYLNPEKGKFYQDAYESIGKHHRFIVGRITKVWKK